MSQGRQLPSSPGDGQVAQWSAAQQKWIAASLPAAFTPRSARAHLAAGFSIAVQGAAGFTKVAFDALDWDDHPGDMDVVTNHQYAVSIAGKYQVNGQVYFNPPNNGALFYASLFKNGAEACRGSGGYWNAGTGLGATEVVATDILNLAVGDVVDLRVFWGNSNGSLANTVEVPPATNFLSVAHVA